MGGLCHSCLTQTRRPAHDTRDPDQSGEGPSSPPVSLPVNPPRRARMVRTKEPQYQFEVELARRHGLARFGIMSNQTWRDDPRRLLFVLSRYKFVAKMLGGKRRVLEVGCADAFGTRLVMQEVASVTAIDFDPVFIRDA